MKLFQEDSATTPIAPGLYRSITGSSMVLFITFLSIHLTCHPLHNRHLVWVGLIELQKWVLISISQSVFLNLLLLDFGSGMGNDFSCSSQNEIQNFCPIIEGKDLFSCSDDMESVRPRTTIIITNTQRWAKRIPENLIKPQPKLYCVWTSICYVNQQHLLFKPVCAEDHVCMKFSLPSLPLHRDRPLEN